MKQVAEKRITSHKNVLQILLQSSITHFIQLGMLPNQEAKGVYVTHTASGVDDYSMKPTKSQSALSWLFLKGSLNDLFKAPLFYNAWYILGTNIFPAFMGFLFWVLASRLYPSDDVGIASVIISTVTLISWIAGLGTNMGLIRFIPESSHPHRMINSVLNLNWILSVLCGVIFILGLPIWANHLKLVLGNILSSFVFIAFVIVSTIGTTIRGCFVAYRRSNYAFIFTLVSNLLRVIFVFDGVYFGSLGLVGGITVAYLIAYLISAFVHMPKVSPGFRRSLQFQWSDIKSLLLFSGSNNLATLTMQLTQTIIPLMTLELLGADLNAYSYIALMIGTLVASPGTALAISAFAEGSNDYGQSPVILKKALSVSLLITVMCSTVVAFGAPWFLSWFGVEYVGKGVGVLRFLACAAPFIVINQLFIAYLRLEKKNSPLILFSLVLMIITLLIAYFLMPIIGILANGIGIFSSNFLLAIIASVLWLKRIKQYKYGEVKA